MSAREKLFNYPHIYDHLGSEAIFVEAMKESVAHHQKGCDFYRKLLDCRGFNADEIRTVEDCYRIPPIPASFLKYHEVLSIDEKEVEVHATSSGTEGQRSQVFIDQSSVELGTKMVIKAMRYHKLISLIPTNYLMMGYEPKPGNEMGNVKIMQGITRFAPAKEKVYALRSLGDTYEIDHFGILSALNRFERQRLPVRIMGFPAYLFMMLKMMKDTGMKPLHLNKRSIILTGGGWKKHDDLMIDKSQLHGLIEELLGIPRENCRDFYSAVEHSVAYPECKHHHMHVPIWSRVVIRDVKTLEPLGYDQAGFINFISPLVTSMPISSVLMGDMAVLRNGSGCPCGIGTPYFEILGRAGTERARSCAVAASELAAGGHNG